MDTGGAAFLITILVTIFAVGGLVGAAVMLGVAYARFMVTALLRETLSAHAVRFTALFVISLDIMALHSIYRFGFAETEWRYPLLSPVFLCLLLLLGSLSVANGAILLSRWAKLPPKAQAAAGTLALLGAAIGHAAFYAHVTG